MVNVFLENKTVPRTTEIRDRLNDGGKSDREGGGRQGQGESQEASKGPSSLD